jgi:exonuclease 3'-5' domain-containing protein 1
MAEMFFACEREMTSHQNEGPIILRQKRKNVLPDTPAGFPYMKFPLAMLCTHQTAYRSQLISSTMASIIVDTVELVRDLVAQIESVVQKPLIFIDLEGVNLSRDGVIAIMQILVPPNPVVHLIDIYTLGKEAFDTSGPGAQTLRGILESRDYPKVFFDVRNDSDAMYSHYQISLGGVIDLQLLEFASRSQKGRFIKGLAKCISEDGSLGWTAYQKWQRTKDEGQRLFAPEKGGNYGVFLERPLSAALREYCVQDVLVMPKLLTVYGGRVPSHLAMRINAETLARVVLSQSANFNGKGRHMAIGPSFAWNGYVSRVLQCPFLSRLLDKN